VSTDLKEGCVGALSACRGRAFQVDKTSRVVLEEHGTCCIFGLC
jgi:hypothetical protein